MSKLVIGVGITVVIFAAVIIGYNVNRSSAPQPPPVQPVSASQIYFEPRLIGLGEQYWGGEGEIFVELLNGGSETVVIESIETSCDCTGHELPEDPALRTLGPGDSYPIQLTMSMGSEVGPKRVVINAVTRDAQRAQAEVEAEIIPTWELQHEGEMWDFGTYHIGGAKQDNPPWTMMFTSQTDRLLEVVSNEKWINIETQPLPGDAVEIIISLNPEGLEPGRLGGYVEVKTDSGLVGSVFRTVRLSVVRALLPSPDPAVIDVDQEARLDFMGPAGLVALITNATVPEESGLQVEVREGVVFVKRTQAAADEQPIRVEVEAEDGRTGWADVVVPDAIELLLPD